LTVSEEPPIRPPQRTIVAARSLWDENWTAQIVPKSANRKSGKAIAVSSSA
jgi:hypothetical protein